MAVRLRLPAAFFDCEHRGGCVLAVQRCDERPTLSYRFGNDACLGLTDRNRTERPSGCGWSGTGCLLSVASTGWGLAFRLGASASNLEVQHHGHDGFNGVDAR